MKDKVLHLNSAFSIKAADQDPQSIYIEGYASTVDVDRQGDVVPSAVWEKGMQNYLKNPIILAYHDHSNPIGRMVEHKTDSKGLWIKARISTAAKQFQLIKDGILTAFSIGFRVLDAEYNSAAEVFFIKDLELVEISVVSIPANQNTLFDLSKAFDNAEEYKRYKEQFATQGQSAKGLESDAKADRDVKKEWNMNPEEIKQMLAQAAREAAEQATKALEARQQAEAQAKAQEIARQAEIDSRVKAAVEAHVQVGQTGAEKLLAEVEKRFESERAAQKNALEGLEAALKEKADELKALQTSKMAFGDKKGSDTTTYQEREMAVLLSKVTGKSLESTRYGKNLVEKAGGHLGGTSNTTGIISAPASLWETEVSTNMENEVRRRLVMAPLMRNVAMQTNVMRMPLNPEAGKATWVQNSDFGNSNNNSSGTTATHVLKEITLNAFKVATREYMALEEEEDSILVLLPLVRDAMLRRVARAVDSAMINGAGTASDPVKGVAMYDAASAVQIDSSNPVTIAKMRALRKDLGAWGLEPSELVYVVNTETYYNLLDDTNFMTVDKIGDRATLLTGQIGSIANTPVVVSGEMPAIAEGTDADATNIAAFCFAPANFLVGNQRGLRVDTDVLTERQSRVLVASLRTGLTQLTNQISGVTAHGVSTLRYVNGAT
jgi:HK97 family phage prohead protease/HK97 family phage major capsid protein